MLHKPQIDVDRLRKAAKVAAEIVSRFGDDYWPVFERIDRELEARLDRKARLAKFNRQEEHCEIQDYSTR